MKICKVEGCGKKHRRNGYCMTHSTRVHRHGDPDAVHPNKQTAEERYSRLKERQNLYRKTPKGRLAYLLKRQKRRHLEGDVLLTADEALRISFVLTRAPA